MNRHDAELLDAQDPLAPLRAFFSLPDGLVYLDGNSLGALPKATPERVRRTVEQEWGRDLIASWNTAGWIDAPRRLGDRIAPWIGARAGEVLVADSTSVNLYKVLHAALQLSRASARSWSVSAATFPPTTTSPKASYEPTAANWCWWTRPKTSLPYWTTAAPSSC